MKLFASDDPVLTTVAFPVPHGDTDIKKVGQDMLAIMHENSGVGLAAPQVGLDRRVIVISHGRIKDQIIVNPVITKTKPEMTISAREGCLSFPGKRVDKKRHKRVTVEGFDENWQPVKIHGRDLLAFIIQHEIDHLNGINIV